MRFAEVVDIRFKGETHHCNFWFAIVFKPNIDDLRESPAKSITTQLVQACNNPDIMVVEPNVKENNLFKLTDYKVAYETADIVVFLVGHREFAELNYRNNLIVLDFCGNNMNK